MRHPRETAPEQRSVLQHAVRCIVPVLILAVGVGAMFALGKRGQGKRDDEDADVPEVRTAPVLPHAGGLLDIEVDGIVTPFRDIEVAAEVNGQVRRKEDACRAGSFVRQDTLLVEIDPRDYQYEVDRYEKLGRQADAEIEELGVEMGNVQALMGFAAQELELNTKELARVASNVYSESERDQAKRSVIASQNAKRALENQEATLRAKRDRLEAAVGVVQAQLQKAKLDRSRTEITAPVDGVIVRDSVEEGSYVQKGSPLFVIEDTSCVEVRCNLQMDDLYWLWYQNAPATVTGDPRQSAYQVPRTPATVFYQMAGHSDVKYAWRGELRRYDGIGVDERTRTVPCRIVVDDPRQVIAVGSKSESVASEAIGPPALVRGMYVTAEVHARPDATFVKIPDAAVQPGKRTWRVRNGKLERIESIPLVKYVQETDDAGEPQWYWLVPSAESGIAADDRLVITPIAGMRDGMAVREQQDTAPEQTESSD